VAWNGLNPCRLSLLLLSLCLTLPLPRFSDFRVVSGYW
jgi:hypothetical protein